MQRGFEDDRMKGRGPCKRDGAAQRRKSGGGNAKVTVTPGRAWSGAAMPMVIEARAKVAVPALAGRRWPEREAA
ncbi:hypothetical protein [Azoarcus olearius]|uniref:Uncharacterized protein n=1 Tax=Azoarcus sp. (strain BH72) TaxID=418699 RepID=A1K3N7_AZOSB|nr:hypothetical protein [Azoarcus olearius]CAL93442.1 hypothetical protein azo0825 [Azoarcus olearius]